MSNQPTRFWRYVGLPIILALGAALYKLFGGPVKWSILEGMFGFAVLGLIVAFLMKTARRNCDWCGREYTAWHRFNFYCSPRCKKEKGGQRYH